MHARPAVLLTISSDDSCPTWSYPYTGTLTRVISFVCHSYENCRVCTQNSHSGTPCLAIRPSRHCHEGALWSLFSLFAPRVFDKPFTIRSIRTLSKNTGVYGVVSFFAPHSPRPTSNYHLISCVFTVLRTLLHFFALTKNSTLLFSTDSTLFAKKPGGGVFLRTSRKGEPLVD